jgi:hypothetical protein
MWTTLEEYGIPANILSLTRDIYIYEGFRCQILREGKLTEYNKFAARVRQSSTLSPVTFLLVLDRVMRMIIMSGRKRGDLFWHEG